MRFPRAAGTDPEKLFRERSRNLRYKRLLMKEGMAPWRLPEAKTKYWRPTTFSRSDGMGPLTLLPERYKKPRLVRFHSSVRSDPVNILKERSNERGFGKPSGELPRLTRSEGIGPLRLFEERFTL